MDKTQNAWRFYFQHAIATVKTVRYVYMLICRPKIITMKLSTNRSRLAQVASLLFLFVLPQMAMSQSAVDSSDIEPCTESAEVDHEKAMDFYFKNNINISAYDWSNTNVNCHIALGYKSNAKKNTLLGSGIAALCVG